MRIGISALNLSTAAGFANAGISRYCFGLLDAMAKLETPHEIFVFTMPDVAIPDSWRKPNFHFPPLDSPLPRNKTVSEWIGGARHIRRHRLDAYLSTAHVVPWRRGIPTALTVHDIFPVTHPEFFTQSKGKLIARVNAWSMRKADRLVANSEFTKREVERVYRFPASKTVAIPLGIGNLRPPVEPGSVSDDELRRIGVPFSRFLFTIGTLEPRKNLPRLLEAFAALAPGLPDGLGLAIAGAKGWMESDIAATADRLGIHDRLRFLGYVPDDDVPKLFARCDLFVLPSVVEGFGLPALEALHFGAPIACSHGGAIPEVAGPAAVLFDPLSVDAIAEGIRAGLRLGDRRAEIVEQGRRFAGRFTWEACARQTLAALEQLAAQ